MHFDLTNCKIIVLDASFVQNFSRNLWYFSEEVVFGVCYNYSSSWQQICSLIFLIYMPFWRVIQLKSENYWW